MRNVEIADNLFALANALEAVRENRFKVRSYRSAARSIQGSHVNISDLVKRDEDLTIIPRVGASIARIIRELVMSGKLAYLDQVKSKLTPEMRDALAHPGLSPALVKRAYKKLQIHNLEVLQRKLQAGEVKAQLGSRVASNLQRAFNPRVSLRRFQAATLCESISEFIRALPAVRDVIIGGAVRRKAAVVDEIVAGVLGGNWPDIRMAIGASGLIAETLDSATALESEVNSKAAARFRLNSGLLLTVLPLRAQSLGLDLVQITGSRKHWNGFRRLSIVHRQRAAISNCDEASAYASKGLAFIPPELREGAGEIAAAAADRLPRLIDLADLRGDLHMHTTASDGANDLPELAAAARQRGYEYIAITDHSQRLKMTNGLSEERLLRQMEMIDAFNATSPGVRVLKSSEVDILEDGALDFPDSVLCRLDMVTCSVHSRFALSRAKQTKRILTAMDNPYFTVLGHATGRLLLSRGPYAVDMKRILRKAVERGCFVEVNANPYRLDIGADYCRMGKDLGLKITISTDAHSIQELDNMQFGVDEARRGWIEASDVLNTSPLAELLKQIAASRQ